MEYIRKPNLILCATLSRVPDFPHIKTRTHTHTHTHTHTATLLLSIALPCIPMQCTHALLSLPQQRMDSPRIASLLAEINSQERVQKDMESNLALRRMIVAYDDLAAQLVALRERIGSQGT